MMIHNTEPLWQRIQQFSLDEPNAVFPFSKRLAREQNWSQEYTCRAIEEYKRFIFLICASDQPMTPSKIVDEVWHLHLLYTRSYWDDFCGELLQRKIHHNPTKGGKVEGQKFEDQYKRTLRLYEINFGTKAPEDIWSTIKKQHSKSQYELVDKDKWYLVPKPMHLLRVDFSILVHGFKKVFSRFN